MRSSLHANPCEQTPRNVCVDGHTAAGSVVTTAAAAAAGADCIRSWCSAHQLQHIAFAASFQARLQVAVYDAAGNVTP